MSDSMRLGQDEVPDVLRTLAGVLPQFSGEGLEAQLQTYDAFLGMVSARGRLAIADLLKEAAAKITDKTSRARVEFAVGSIRAGGAAAAPYDHAAAMAAYTKEYRGSNPEAAAPVSVPAGAEVAPTISSGTCAHPQVLAQVDLIEAELKRIGRWSENSPAEFLGRIERGELRSYMEAPTFELWLQCVLLPRARQGATDDQLPSSSMVGEMARRQYDYMSVDPDAQELLAMLQRFDELVMAANG